jgi:hypothetical protein
MSRRLVFVFAAGLSLGGCCLGITCNIPPPTGVYASWDGLGPDPRRLPARVIRAKLQVPSQVAAAGESSPSEAELAALKPYSKEWTAAFNAINRAADDELKRKLVICQGCLPPEPDDRTGTVSDAGYVPARP